MYFTDEKDYIMRMIKEMVRVLFSLMFGKKYVSVELEKENKYEVSGKNLKDFLDMIDSGKINEAVQESPPIRKEHAKARFMAIYSLLSVH